MSEVLVVAEHLDGKLRDVTLEAVSAALELKAGLGGTVSVAVLSSEPHRLTDTLALEGVDELITVKLPDDAFNGDVYRHTIGALISERHPRVVVAGFTVSAMSWAPALAGSRNLGFASDVVSASAETGSVVASREFYGAKVRGELEFPAAETVVLLIRATAWPPAAGAAAEPRVSNFEPPAGDTVRERHVEYLSPMSSDVDITTAEIVLAIGRGVGERENVAQFEELAAKLGATLAASRPLVDAGWLPPERQVGQSGRTVKPKVYVALGISGAVQHLAGMKGATTIVAVNTDPEASIFNVAHYSAVVDLFAVADELGKLS